MVVGSVKIPWYSCKLIFMIFYAEVHLAIQESLAFQESADMAKKKSGNSLHHRLSNAASIIRPSFVLRFQRNDTDCHCQ